ncbi:response regulator [Enterocloster aldenensis]|uniref:response regulator transcription factor n=1 Tax=Enterocloster aldenensis TaxID=358742 RepID=UPI000E53DA47|nr:response regulator [Enterocloster aldenensis]
MFKLIIADDERLIREALSATIDWKSHDIELAGVCRNGIEAYDMILDESPDIVLTDIRMPGMNGLDLIKRTHEAGIPAQFILLSGYGEFEYAKTAMQYGVKHYILKPYDDQQIIDCMKQCKKDCCQIRLNNSLGLEHFTAQSNILHNVMSSILNECICQDKTLDSILEHYEQYIDFYFTSYKLLYVYYLEFENLEPLLGLMKEYAGTNMPRTIIYGVYVNHTLLLFFQNIGDGYQHLRSFIQQAPLPSQKVTLETRLTAYSSLKDLLEETVDRLRRFGMIYYINNFHAIYTCNYNRVISQLQELYANLLRETSSRNGMERGMEYLSQVEELLNGINSLDFLKQLTGNLLLKITASQPSQSTIELTNWLIRIDKETDLPRLREIVSAKLRETVHACLSSARYSSMTQQIFEYVKEHLQDPNLSLKMIAENHLYMNVDYVSKKFYKETGQKFSHYLTEMRMQRAKDMMTANPSASIQAIAMQIGCGNNPKYFSQLFKKQEGMTPTEYLAGMESSGRG